MPSTARARPSVKLSAIILFGLGLLLMVADVGWRLDLAALDYWRWGAEHDGSFAEWFGSLQLLLAAGVLLVLGRRLERASVLPVIALALAVMVADDLGRFHENYGAWIARRLALPAVLGERPEAVGELLIFGAYAVVLGGLGIVAYLRSGAAARRVTHHIAAGVLLLAFCAVGLDVLGPVAAQLTGIDLLKGVFRLLENAGELASCTVICLVSLWHLRRLPGRARSTA